MLGDAAQAAPICRYIFCSFRLKWKWPHVDANLQTRSLLTGGWSWCPPVTSPTLTTGCRALPSHTGGCCKLCKLCKSWHNLVNSKVQGGLRVGWLHQPWQRADLPGKQEGRLLIHRQNLHPWVCNSYKYSLVFANLRSDGVYGDPRQWRQRRGQRRLEWGWSLLPHKLHLHLSFRWVNVENVINEVFMKHKMTSFEKTLFHLCFRL